MKKFYALFLCAFSFASFAQPTGPIQLTDYPSLVPDWGLENKAMGDSCGFYFNNYVGIGKTSSLTVEYLSIGDAVNDNRYNGRAQRFSSPQAIEVHGVEFYSYFNEPSLDSIMVITTLNNYDAVADSMGTELARDTVYVKNTTFSSFVPSMSVKSYFDNPVTVTEDYMITVFTTTNLELYIIANSHPSGDGNFENLSYALYNNPTPGYEIYNGWYANLTDFSFNYDYLIAPLIKYQAHNSFTIDNDTVCPSGVSNVCVNYAQQPFFNSLMYNQNASNSTQDIVWNWGTSFTNSELTFACHTYGTSGTYSIQLTDNLKKWDYTSANCNFVVSRDIYVWDEPIANFSVINSNLTAEFTNLSLNYTTLTWDFGDGSPTSSEENPTHVYSDIDSTYEVWLFVENDCFIDSIMFEVTTDNVGVKDNNKNELVIYPNPANNQFTIANAEIGSVVFLYNIVGEEVFHKVISNEKQNFQISNLPAGTYFVQIRNNQNITTKKLVVK